MIGLPEPEETRYQALLRVIPSTQDAVVALVQGLYDESWRVRRVASEQLAVTPDPEGTVARLLAVLADREHTGARNAAAEALIRLGGPSIPSLLARLVDGDGDQRKFAADILGEIHDPRAAPGLAKAMADEDANVRVSAAEALGKMGGADAAHALEKGLASEDSLLQLACLNGLGAMNLPPPLPAVAALLDNPRLRKSAYRTLGLIRQPAAVDLICRGLAATAGPVRTAAFAALGVQFLTTAPADRSELDAAVREACHQGRLFEGSLHALGSAEMEVVAGALWVARATEDARLAIPVAETAQEPRLFDDAVAALVTFGAAATRPLLAGMGALSGPGRAAAAEAMVQLADPSLVADLVALVETREPEVQLPAVRALGNTGSAEAIAPLMSLLASSEVGAPAAHALIHLAGTYKEQVRVALEQAMAAAPSPAGLRVLARVAGSAAAPWLKDALKHPDAVTRAAAAEAAADVGPAESLEVVRIALVDEAAPVRCAALYTVGRSHPPGSAKLLEASLGDPDSGVRAAAAQAIGEAGLPELAPALERLISAPDGVLAVVALRALARVGKLSGESLKLAEQHADPEVVKEALRAGAALPEGSLVALQRLSDSRWDVRIAAARLLAASGRREHLEAVRAALSKEADSLVQEALAEAARKLGQR